MDLEAFFMENVPGPEEREVQVSERFPKGFRVRGISEEENRRLRAGCRKEGSFEVDPERYLARLAAACVVFPDLESAALQRSWGVMGAEALLQKMLSAGEFAKLLEAAEAVCGFEEAEEVSAEIKKGSCRATRTLTTPTTPCRNGESGRGNMPG